MSWHRALALLNPEQKARLYKWLFITTVNSVFSAAGIVSVMPFVALLSSPSIIESNQVIHAIYTWLNLDSYNAFIALFGVFTIVVFLVSNTFAIYESYTAFAFSNDLEYEFSRELFTRYVHQDYEFFLRRKRSDLTRRLTQEIERGIIGIVSNGVLVYSSFLLVAILIVLLMLIDPAVTLITAVVLLAAYILIDRLVRRRVKQLGREFISISDRLFSTTLEMLSGIKEVKIYGAEDRFIDEFSHFYRLLTQRSTHFRTLNLIPRQVLEIVAYGGIILFAIFVVTFYSDPAHVFPLIAMYGLSAYRLIPALRSGFSGLEQMKYSEPALDIISRDLQMPPPPSSRTTGPTGSLPLTHSIRARSLSFGYADNQTPVIKDASLSIPAGKSTVLMGASGVGKSTLIDLLVGLLIPQSGAVEIDDQALTRGNLANWQGSIGYVPQKVYLFEDSIARNVAVSERSHAVDLERVIQACRIARFHDFVMNELEEGYETLVGQGKKELSGGQLKRLGIARALYRGPKVIVMDEATTELDSATEAEILSEIMTMKGLTKIFISHDIALARRCDHLIYFDRDGKITEGDPAILEEIGFARLAATN